ncbi:MAG TPA: hypothetical protein DDZ67_11910 [Xanthomonadaceae bacterium]|nr:hypothetical protein [Xanthomonadaceae bacterium]
MWVLGKFALLVVMAISGLLLLVGSLPWLSYLLHDAPLPSRRIGALWAGTLGSALVLGIAIWSYRRLERQRQRVLERRRQAHLQATRHDRAFRARGRLALPLLLIPIVALFGFGSRAAVATGHWGVAALLLATTLLVLWLAWQLLWQLLRPGPLLCMDATGIDHALYGPIPWRDVIGIQLQSTQTRYGQSHVLMLGVRGAARYLRNAPLLPRWLHGRKLRGPEAVGALPIPLGLLAEDPELVHQSARTLRERVGAPFVPYWHPRMDDKDIDVALRMQAMNHELERMTERMRSAPADSGTEQAIEFEAEANQHIQRHLAQHDALMPELNAVLERQRQRFQHDARRLRLLRWLPLVVLAAWLLSRLLR